MIQITFFVLFIGISSGIMPHQSYKIFDDILDVSLYAYEYQIKDFCPYDNMELYQITFNWDREKDNSAGMTLKSILKHSYKIEKLEIPRLGAYIKVTPQPRGEKKEELRR